MSRVKHSLQEGTDLQLFFGLPGTCRVYFSERVGFRTYCDESYSGRCIGQNHVKYVAIVNEFTSDFEGGITKNRHGAQSPLRCVVIGLGF